MLILSEKYPELRIGGLAKFSGGKVEVSDPDIVEQLRGFAHMGVVVPEAAPVVPENPPADPPKDPDEGAKQPEGSGTVLERPAGNASLEAWQAYAIQEGHDVADLKQSDIRALFAAE